HAGARLNSSTTRRSTAASQPFSTSRAAGFPTTRTTGPITASSRRSRAAVGAPGMWSIVKISAVRPRTGRSPTRSSECDSPVRRSGGAVEDRAGAVAVHVIAAVPHTMGGLAIAKRARVVDGSGTPIPGLYAAGVDAGGWSTGGYASGLAAALVFGLVAAEDAA